MALTDALEEFEGAIAIVTHSEEILRRVAKRLIVFQGDAPFVFEGTYDEFLDAIGWEGEENSVRKQNKKKNKPSGSKDQKREKAELVQEKSRALTPARKEVEDLEKLVAALEKKIAKAQEDLARASAAQDSAQIQSASLQLAAAEKELEMNLARWEEAAKRVTDLEKVYAERVGHDA
jgi:ATP-binding cassette subfamily F protein 3